MRRKPLSWQIPRPPRFPGVIAAILFSVIAHLEGADQISSASKFLGANACASSGCHGGGKENQFVVWSLRDFHSQRPFATLTTARSKQIGEALQIKDPAVDNRCASCHAPLREVPENLHAHTFKVSEGISCESCHGPAESWLRTHTRPDYNHADRVAIGMRDLKSLYVRANTCVACHQTVALPLLKAGHPELMFELDGQCVLEPRHWREATNWHGAQAWLVGQAAALREMSWQLSRSPAKDEKLAMRCDALLWVVSKLADLNSYFPELEVLGAQSSAPNYRAVQSSADLLAKRASEASWSAAMTFSILNALAKSGADFRRPEVPAEQHARRADRLVLALDRLLASLPEPSADTKLNELFKLSQSLPDFDPARFSAALDEFARVVGK